MDSFVEYKFGYIIKNVIAALIGIGLIALLFYKFQFSRIKASMNCTGPSGWPFLGHLYHTMVLPIEDVFTPWTVKYGQVFCFFFGLKPQIAIADCEVIRQIAIKDFDVFTNHTMVETINDKYTKHFLFFLRDSDWKRLRAMLTPTFTSSKIKTMYKIIDVCGDDIVKCIDEQVDDRKSFEGAEKLTLNSNNKRVAIKLLSTFQLYTLDAIASCCYAMKFKRQKGDYTIEDASKRNEFVKQLLDIFSVDAILTILSFVLPASILPYLYKRKNYYNLEYIDNKLRNALEDRRKSMQNGSSKRHNDYMQILLDAKLNDKLELNESDIHENHHANVSENSLLVDHQKNLQESAESNNNKNVLSDEEMISNAIFLLSTGLDTTSQSLQSTFYALAMHQRCQDRLYEELKRIAKKREDGTYEFSYEELTANAYLDSIICESIRIHSPVYAIDRQANQDYTIEKYNVNLSKGTSVFFLYQIVHRDENYWPEPLKFYPERFMPENRHKIVPGSYTPFGQGPRHCVAMRFSLTETKIAIAKVLMNFKFVPKPDNAWPLKVDGNLLYTFFKDCEVLIERRVD